MRIHPGAVAPMPPGPAIFETTGLWEDYATPSRDMRILIALKVLADLPERIRRHPELFLLHDESPAAAAARASNFSTASASRSVSSPTPAATDVLLDLASLWGCSTAPYGRISTCREFARRAFPCAQTRN